MNIVRILTVALLSGPALWAQPRITQIRNAGGFLPPGVPHHAVARGSVFRLTGTGLGPVGTISQTPASGLSRNPGGVSVKVTVAGVPSEAIPYSVSPGQIDAILPAATGEGDGSVTVTFNGQTSPALPVRIVTSAFGIKTVDGSGTGTADVTAAGGTPVTFLNAANPGETVTFKGTGLGPDPNDETAEIAAPADLAGLPLDFYIGGVKAEVLYHGRTASPGWDEIRVVVPSGANGCFVSAYAKTGAYVSNFVTFPVAPEGRNCTELGFSPDDFPALFSREQINAGWLYLGQFIQTVPAIGPVPASTSITDSANAGFIKYTPFVYSNYGGRGDPAYGSCVVTAALGNAVAGPQASQYLDAGPDITLTPPSGPSIGLVKESPIPAYIYSSAPPLRPRFIPDGGGTFTFKIPGGNDVGAVEVPVSTTAPLLWTNRASITPDVSRARPLEFTWEGGEPDSYVILYGAASNGANPPVFTSFNCAERVEAGRFTVPAEVMSSMVPSFVAPGPFSVPSGQLAIINYRVPTKFEAPGLDVGNVSFYVWHLSIVNFR